MKPINILLIVVVIVLIVIVFYSFHGTQDETNYSTESLKEREEKDRFMKTSAESPVVTKDDFKGLKYYPPDIRYKIIADLEPVEKRNILVLSTNDGKEQRYAEYAYARFTLEGIENRLLILEVLDMGPFRGKLFLAFGDETSAVETYGAGRYLDVSKVPGATTITLDFNKAYNPYCAYNETYSCPLPPSENLLKVAIRAGEKIYEH